MRWAEAVKIWNQHKKSINPSHIYALPKKGTPEHAHAKHIQMGGDPEKFEAPRRLSEHTPSTLFEMLQTMRKEREESKKKFQFKKPTEEELRARKREKVKAFLKEYMKSK